MERKKPNRPSSSARYQQSRPVSARNGGRRRPCSAQYSRHSTNNNDGSSKDTEDKEDGFQPWWNVKKSKQDVGIRVVIREIDDQSGAKRGSGDETEDEDVSEDAFAPGRHVYVPVKASKETVLECVKHSMQLRRQIVQVPHSTEQAESSTRGKGPKTTKAFLCDVPSTSRERKTETQLKVIRSLNLVQEEEGTKRGNLRDRQPIVSQREEPHYHGTYQFDDAERKPIIRPVTPRRKRYSAHVQQPVESRLDHCESNQEAEKSETEQPTYLSTVLRQRPKSAHARTQKEMRDSERAMVLHAAVLAHKHSIKYLEEDPEFRFQYDLKRERVQALDKISDVEKTRILLDILQEESQEDEEENSPDTTFFGWDAMTTSDIPNSKKVWDQVSDHMQLSALLQSMGGAKGSLPEAKSARLALRILSFASQAIEDETLKSSLQVAARVLKASIFCTPPQEQPEQQLEQPEQQLDTEIKEREFSSLTTYWDENRRLKEENQRLLSKVQALEKEVRGESRAEGKEKERNQGESKSSACMFLSQALQSTSKACGMDPSQALSLFLQDQDQVDVSFDQHIVPLLRRLRDGENPLHKEQTVKLLASLFSKQVMDERDVELALGAIFERDDAVQAMRWLMDTRPLIEKQVLLSSRPLAKQITFWEIHWSVFSDILWMSPELLQSIVSKREDVMGRILFIYSNWLGFGNKARPLPEVHMQALDTLLNQVIERNASFLEGAITKNRQVLREVLESERTGEELLKNIVQNSPCTLGVMLDNSKPVLADLLKARAALLGTVFKESPSLLHSVIRNSPVEFARSLAEDEDGFTTLCASLPRLIDFIVKACPEEVGKSMAVSAAAVVAVLEQVNDEVLVDQVLKQHPRLLLGNEARLGMVGLVNIASYREACSTKQIQTDPVQHAGESNVVVRSLTDIVGKKKQIKGPPSAAWTVETLQQTIAAIFQAKVNADYIDDRAGHPREPFAEVVHDYFMEELPNAAMAKKALSAFTAAARANSESTPLLYWFGLLSGATKPEDFNPRGIDFYLAVLCALVPSDSVAECLSELEGDTVVPLNQVLSNLKSVIAMYWYDKQAQEGIMDKLRSLQVYEVPSHTVVGDWEERKTWAKFVLPSTLNSPTSPTSPSEGTDDEDHQNEESTTKSTKNSTMTRSSKRLKSVVKTRVFKKDRLANEIELMLEHRKKSLMQNSAASLTMSFKRRTRSVVGCVVLQHVLDVIMGEWFAFEQREIQTLVDLFVQGDSDGNGILDFGEFQTMVLIVDPHCDSRTVLRMFKMTGEETEDGEHVISPDEFVRVMRAHKYTGPALAHLIQKNDPPEEPKEINSDVNK